MEATDKKDTNEVKEIASEEELKSNNAESAPLKLEDGLHFDISDSESSEDSSSLIDEEDNFVIDPSGSMLSDDEIESGKININMPLRTFHEIVEAPEFIDIQLTELDVIHKLGKIEHIVGQIAVIRPYYSNPALDLESVLCLENRQIVGKIQETFGSVEDPLYYVLFAPKEVTDEKKDVETSTEGQGKKIPTIDMIHISQEIYYVEAHTTFITPQNIYTKGYDASDMHDEEIPEENLEFSDDEAEALAKKKKKPKKRKRNTPVPPAITAPSGSTQPPYPMPYYPMPGYMAYPYPYPYYMYPPPTYPPPNNQP